MATLTPFQRALAAGRDRYNARYRQARRRDPAAFLAHLRDRVGPVVDAAGVEADPVPLTDVLVELSLQVGELDRAEAGFALLRELAPFAGVAPRRVPAAVLNALRHLADSPTGDPVAWSATVVELAARIPARDPDTLLAAGGVAAWRHGLARLRPSALARAAALRPDLLGIALGTTSTVDLSALAADPWASPAAAGRPRLQVVRRVGAFTGFGGAFRRPPLIHAAEGRWYATVDEQTWEITTDRFGHALRRVAEAPTGPATGDLTLRPGGRVVDGRDALDVPELATATSVAAVGATLAATTTFSHSIVFVARTTG
ncbi:hypothetical protein [Actinokineospora sp. NBRC 105648]|uniref:hypothetical protein n=1 Tax=Actinokineospora sp. NBRC 105648 TaxID=3032206 RepID=UPI00249FC511|nr:hypothetical protein [Actinokineospora sp. NBRC 105648]GLZ36762.1 hypothetical protein Acsp05_03870 [Actinokineospora sp. NBRC 105648]